MSTGGIARRLLLAVALAPVASSAFAASVAQGDAAGVRVSVRAGGGSLLDTGPIPSGAAGNAPLDYEIVATVLETDVQLGALAAVSSGPLRAGVRATLKRELSEASAGAQSVDVRIGGALGVVIGVDGAASTAILECRGPAPTVALDAELEGVTLSVLGVPVSVGANAAPNTVVPLALAGARLVLNEQTTSGGSAVVHALRLTLDDVALLPVPLALIDAEVVVSRAAVSLAACGTFIDSDGDGRTDATDNCPTVRNGDQRDTDRDGEGDACDVDDDADLFIDTVDTCPLEPNPLQGPCLDPMFGNGFETP